LEAVPAQSAKPKCSKVHDDSVPEGTTFPNVLSFELGKNDLTAFDSIVIKEVRSTIDRFDVGGMYLVRGEYTLSSAAEAHIVLSVSATAKGEGCTTGTRQGRVAIKRGTGKFELLMKMPYEGYPHVWFSSDGGQTSGSSLGGVYFGKGTSLRK
jgi:hypothetical protein